MLTKVAENIYRKTVPLPNNPLRDINAYIITGERNLLIDTGFNRPPLAGIPTSIRAENTARTPG